MKTFKNFFYETPYDLQLEMAFQQKNITGLRKLYDDHDLKWLHNFPIDKWNRAIAWRYSEGLLRASEAREQGITPDGVQEVRVFAGHGKWLIFQIDPKSMDLITQLEKPVDIEQLRNLSHDEIAQGKYTGGHNDWDVSAPMRAKDKKGNVRTDLKAQHSFSSFETMPQDPLVTAKRTLRLWFWATQAGILGESRKEFDGQPTTMSTVKFGSETFVVPVVKKTLNYTLVDKTGKQTPVSKEVEQPVLNNGRLVKSPPSHRTKVKEAFNLDAGRAGDKELTKTYLTDFHKGDILNKLKEMNIGSARLQDAQEWLEENAKSGSSKTLADLLKFLDFRESPNDEANRVSMLKAFDRLSPEQQSYLSSQYTSAHVAKRLWDDEYKANSPSLSQMYLFGGWDAQKQQGQRYTCADMSVTELRETIGKWYQRFLKQAEKGKKSFCASLAGTGPLNSSIASCLASNDQVEAVIADWLAYNLCHPKWGVGQGKEEVMSRDPNEADEELDKRQKGFAKDMCRRFAQLDLDGMMGTRRRRNKMGVSLDSPASAGGSGEEGATVGSLTGAEKKVSGLAGTEVDKATQGQRSEANRTKVGAVDIATWLHMKRPDFSGDMTITQDEMAFGKKAEDIQAAFQALYNQHLAKGNSSDDSIEFAAANLPDELDRRGIEYDKDLAKSVAGQVGKSAGEDTGGFEEEDEIVFELQKLAQQGEGKIVLPNGNEVQIDLETLSKLDDNQLNQTLQVVKKYFNDNVHDAIFNQYWPQVEKRLAALRKTAAPGPTTSAPTALDQKYKSLERIYAAFVKDTKTPVPKVAQFLANPENITNLRQAGQMLSQHPDPQVKAKVQSMMKWIEDYLKWKQEVGTLQGEAAVVAGYPPYDKGEVNKVQRTANFWGAVDCDPNGGNCNTGNSIEGDPIGAKKKKKKSLKEYLEEQKLNYYRSRLEERVKNVPKHERKRS